MRSLLQKADFVSFKVRVFQRQRLSYKARNHISAQLQPEHLLVRMETTDKNQYLPPGFWSTRLFRLKTRQAVDMYAQFDTGRYALLGPYEFITSITHVTIRDEDTGYDAILLHLRSIGDSTDRLIKLFITHGATPRVARVTKAAST